MNKSLLIVFCKNPALGRVKTRLAKSIGEEKALAVYYKLLSNTRAAVKDVKADVAIFYDHFIDSEDEWDNNRFLKETQSIGDIGERMFHALSKGKEWGYEKVCLIGSDIYDLTAEVIDEAFVHLNDNDYVLGPAKDGGYYLIGCSNPVYKVFQLKAWSHDGVLDQTINKIQKIGFSYKLIKELNDIDTIDDLRGTSFEPLIAN